MWLVSRERISSPSLTSTPSPPISYPSHPSLPSASLCLPLPPSASLCLPLPLPFRPRYVWLQVVSAALMGTFYASRRTLSNTLWEPITLHAANNLFACLIPGGDPSVLGNPLFVGAVVHALLLHTYLCWRDMREIVERRGREEDDGGDDGDGGDGGDGGGGGAQQMRLQLLKEGREEGPSPPPRPRRSCVPSGGDVVSLGHDLTRRD